MTCYEFECSHWLRLQHSDFRANLVKDFFLENKFSTNAMRALKFITGHVTYNPAYTYKSQLKTTIELQCEPQKRKQTHPYEALLDKKVNQRTSKCTSYINSLFKVLYPKGTNPRKK